MSLKDNNIEELFRSGLEDLEFPVNDTMWSNISNGMAQTGAGTSAASTAGTAGSKLLTYLGLSGAACAVGVAATMYFTSPSEKENNPITETEIAQSNQNPSDATTQEWSEGKEDQQLTAQIVEPENESQDDPLIEKNPVVKESKKVVVVDEKDKYQYKGSWVNSFLTPKTTPYTEPTQKAEPTDIVSGSESKEDLPKPFIEEVKEDGIIASIVAMPVGGYAPLEVSFAHYSEKGKVHWDFGDGNTSTNPAPAHVFEKFGKYTVTLTITDENGKKYQDYRVIEVLANSALTKIPNIFTPNNDGTNDFFRVEGKNIAAFNLAILTSLGEMVYQSEDINESWDGKDKFGELLPDGTYVVIISARGIDGKKYEHSGTVTLKK